MAQTPRRAAIVTGASRGIGAAIAERLARDGLSVLVNYSGDAKSAEAVVAGIAEAGGVARAFKASVADPAAVKAMFNEAEQAFGGVDVLVNNAGIMELAPLAETEDEMFDRTAAINLKGVFNGLKEAARRLRDGGRVVNLSTSVVGTYFPHYGAYAASKAGVEALTRVFSKELGARGVTVNAVAPGPVETQLFMAGKTDAQLQAARERSPLGRIGQPDDIAAVISFLVGSDGGWVNGQVIRANGGAI
jgi:3-oxoacyl-[acyl-carrier protein] reductase